MKGKEFIKLFNTNSNVKILVVKFSELERLKLSVHENYDYVSGMYLGKFQNNFYDFEKNNALEDFPVYLTLIIEDNISYLKAFNLDIKILLTYKNPIFWKSKIEDVNILKVIKNRAINDNQFIEDFIDVPVTIPLSALREVGFMYRVNYDFIDESKLSFKETKERLIKYNEECKAKIKSEYDVWNKVLNSRTLKLK